MLKPFVTQSILNICTPCLPEGPRLVLASTVQHGARGPLSEMQKCATMHQQPTYRNRAHLRVGELGHIVGHKFELSFK